MDARYRNAARSVVVDGCAEDLTRLLMLRVRAGEVAWDRVLLAAFLGDPIAQAAAGRDAPEASKHERRWARGLVRCGGEDACARAVVVLHRAVVRGVKGLPEPVGVRSTSRNLRRMAQLPAALRYAVDAAELWLERPSPGNAQSVLFEVGRYRGQRDATNEWERWRWPVCTLAEAVVGGAGGVLEPTLLATTRLMAPSHSRWGRDQASRALRAEIARRLVPWTLGECTESQVPVRIAKQSSSLARQEERRAIGGL